MASSSVGPYTPDYDLRYRGYRLQANLYEGQALIHICEKVWYTRGSWQAGPSTLSTPDSKRRCGQFTKKGVMLTVDMWEKLLISWVFSAMYLRTPKATMTFRITDQGDEDPAFNVPANPEDDMGHESQWQATAQASGWGMTTDWMLLW